MLLYHIFSDMSTKWQHSDLDYKTMALKYGAQFTSSALVIAIVGVNWLQMNVLDMFFFSSISLKPMFAAKET